MFLRIEEPLCPTFAFINTGFHVLLSTNHSALSQRQREGHGYCSFPGQADTRRATAGRTGRNRPTATLRGRTAPPASPRFLHPRPAPRPKSGGRRTEKEPPLPSPRSPRHTNSTDFTSPAAIFAQSQATSRKGPSRLSRNLSLALRHRPLQPATFFA